ncbi:MAG: efflux RND transporter periplasmic adaptor subunit [Burkholderiales bacterium]|nr:MAG: efflux RND transporter periplasmic adaptor subunit [Burkholderiales bacterium]
MSPRSPDLQADLQPDPQPDPAASRRTRRLLPRVLVLIAAVAGGSAWWAYAQQRPPATEGASGPASAAGAASKPRGSGRVQPVSVATVSPRDIQVQLSAIGNITAANTAVVKPKIEAELRRVLFKEGQWVKAGTLLAELDDRSLQIALAQAQGQLARDEAVLANAQVDLERFRDLLAKDAIAKQQVDTQAALVRQLQGTVQIDQASVGNARLLLSYTRITAPIDGRVGLRQVDLGNVVKPGDPNGLVTLTQAKPVNVVFAVPDTHLQAINEQLAAGARLPVEAWDREGRQRLAVGQLGSTDNAIDIATSTIKLKAAFPNDTLALFPNQFVNVRLRLNQLTGQLAVPAAALLRDGQGSFVYRVGEDRTVSARRVTAGATDGGWVAVQGDVKLGDTVVTDGVDRLREGASVEVIKPAGRDAGDAPGKEGGRRKRDR